MSNSDNPGIGAAFQSKVNDWFNINYGPTFEEEVKIPIGADETDRSEYKDHKFDVVSKVRTFVIECKCYTWTNTGNVPSAKMGTLNEAAFYMSLLPPFYKKIIVMRKCMNESRGETLAQYYLRTYRHLLGDIVVAEFDPDKSNMDLLNGIHGISRKEMINSFATKYLNLLSQNIATRKGLNKELLRDCSTLGFIMDGGEAISNRFGVPISADSSAFGDFKDIDDMDLLGSGIFSKCKYISYWNNDDNWLNDSNRRWQVMACDRLKKISE